MISWNSKGGRAILLFRVWVPRPFPQLTRVLRLFSDASVHESTSSSAFLSLTVETVNNLARSEAICPLKGKLMPSTENFSIKSSS